MLRLLRRLRENSSITQADLAAKIGMTQSTLSKCERGERRIDLAELRRICLALNCPLKEFVESFESALEPDDRKTG